MYTIANLFLKCTYRCHHLRHSLVNRLALEVEIFLSIISNQLVIVIVLLTIKSVGIFASIKRFACDNNLLRHSGVLARIPGGS